MTNLAIVIPAYKSVFLAKTLQSLAEQTCKDFNVYIGNDAGDIEIETIVRSFENRLNIHYKYFEKNLGSASLVKQWERCFTLTQQEEWFWILPDDDYADPKCVELFYRELSNYDFDVFRFNVHFVTADEKIFKTNIQLAPLQSSYENLLEKLSFSRAGTVAEFIFRKKKFDQIGFAEIPMAWGADDMLWFLMGRDKGIRGSNEAFVYLRQSDFNISNNYLGLAAKKVAANFIFFEQLIKTDAFVEENYSSKKKLQFNEISLKHIMYNLQDFSLKLGILKMYEYAVKGNRIWGGGVIKNMRRFYLNNKRIAKRD